MISSSFLQFLLWGEAWNKGGASDNLPLLSFVLCSPLLTFLLILYLLSYLITFLVFSFVCIDRFYFYLLGVLKVFFFWTARKHFFFIPSAFFFSTIYTQHWSQNNGGASDNLHFPVCVFFPSLLSSLICFTFLFFSSFLPDLIFSPGFLLFFFFFYLIVLFPLVLPRFVLTFLHPYLLGFFFRGVFPISGTLPTVTFFFLWSSGYRAFLSLLFCGEGGGFYLLVLVQIKIIKCFL